MTTQVVGILARARKNRLVHYEGETLWQVIIHQIRSLNISLWLFIILRI